MMLFLQIYSIIILIWVITYDLDGPGAQFHHLKDPPSNIMTLRQRLALVVVFVFGWAIITQIINLLWIHEAFWKFVLPFILATFLSAPIAIFLRVLNNTVEWETDVHLEERREQSGQYTRHYAPLSYQWIKRIPNFYKRILLPALLLLICAGTYMIGVNDYPYPISLNFDEETPIVLLINRFIFAFSFLVIAVFPALMIISLVRTFIRFFVEWKKTVWGGRFKTYYVHDRSEDLKEVIYWITSLVILIVLVVLLVGSILKVVPLSI